ncbi:hypothetical protein EV383_0796 [Pseudonocardia sediminis]|uniref:Uncharacterized protein n=1 Tax=Pseudonocardia sediminis TaxID=1397368 RepID=A0A4Q7UQP4_PSEST|nr:hypothetical protein [Pseudonocardia sediminis]RZT83965.1 hypothetical protein EV383_0796 [Pseudonocardia sediminis]
MSRIVVASKYVLSDYPGMRAGRIYAGKPDLTRHPNAETHVVEGPDAVETLCGRPRADFPHEFADGTTLGKRADPCAVCKPAGPA